MYALSDLQKQERKASYLAILLLGVISAIFLAVALSFGAGEPLPMVYGAIGIVLLLFIIYLRVRMKSELNQGYDIQDGKLRFYRNGVLKEEVPIEHITTITHYLKSGIYEFSYDGAYITEAFPYTPDILKQIKEINPHIEQKTNWEWYSITFRYLFKY
ncbi:hypothetical protein AB9P05_20100 [Roseivirga sp. BDSF3-8]|uniref:hypothetical protein n=1 Tax=Roseivirga sp. BDSF3-8 TaxID=3241598 RepID=UPI003532064B